ncbi:MAG TPA: hypothetical protein VEJ47_02495 [Candidatus Eremiobacteraceae bacterium]|nr:hypothetical protein [Candidatus Eremiobacteraceae bacterium]
MHRPDLVAFAITLLIVLALVAYRLLWAASSAASGAALGRLSILPASWRRWLLGEKRDAQQ